MTKIATGLSAIAALVALGSPPALARPMTPEDLATLNRLGSPAASPDGSVIAYQLTTTDLTANRRDTGLYLLDMKGPNPTPRRIADTEGKNESAPAFSADGRALYFLSDRSGSSQVWRAALDGGDTVQVTSAATDIAGFKLSPMGDKLAVWADLGQDCTLSGCPQEKPKQSGSGRLYDHMFVRHWDTWEVPGEYSTLFVLPLGTDGLVDGDAVNVSGSLGGDTPTKPFGGGEEIAWLADGSALAFTLRKSDAQEPLSTNTDIYVARADNARPLVNLSAANMATDTLPAASPDGRYLAWAAMARPGYEADKLTVKLLDLETRKLVSLTQDWDRSVGSLVWAKDSKSLLATAGDTLETPAFRIDVPSGKVTRLTERGHVSDVLPLPGGAMVYAIDSVIAPADLVLMQADGRTRRLTNVNADRLAGIDPVRFSKFSFKGANGDTVWGEIVKPSGTREKLPLAFVVHGGPQGSFGNSWSYRWNPMVMASQGYAVVSVDFHGSTGYGQAFTDSINQDWGGKPLEDLKLGLAAALKLDGQIDGDNACALGASYGGYMMNWIQGNWPDRFKCIVNHDGVFDLRGMAFATEELWFDQWDQGGPWWSRPDPEKWNPVNFVEKWRTPMLVVHGEKDFRIPISQSLGAFTALQTRGIPSKLLVFPDENHWVLKPQNSVQWHHTVFDWLGRWLKDKPGG